MKFKFKKREEPVFSSDFWYDLTGGGYIRPKDILSEYKQIDKLIEAIELVAEFKEQAFDSGALESN